MDVFSKSQCRDGGSHCQQNRHTDSAGLKLRHVVFAALLMVGAPATASQEERQHTTIPLLSDTERNKLESLLTVELQRVADQKKHFEEQKSRINVNVRLDAITEKLVIDIGAEYGPLAIGGEAEDFQSLLHNEASLLLEKSVLLKGIEFRYGGKDFYHYFPTEWQPPRPGAALKRADKAASDSTIVVAAGHGVYYHHGFGDWRAQRDPSHGIVEDFLSSGYAAELTRWLNQRSESTVLSARSTSITTHTPSGNAWSDMAARYYLEDILPDNPEIWHSLPTSTANDRQRREDILSRPLYANHVAADTIIHLHTNAAGPAATGAMTFYHEDREADKLLAESLLCYMKELIHAKESYKNYTVQSRATPRGDLGENRLAKMPSVIVETGFHTNVSDATALQDPVFRTAAMKGVEKGYRLHGEGKGCEPLKISETPDASGPFGTPVPMEVHYEGHPQFPVTVKIEIADCPIDATCNGGNVPFSEKVSSPLRYSFLCRETSDTSATARLRTTLIDADDVKAVSTEHEVTCTPSTRSTPDLAPIDSSKPSLTVDAS